MPNENLACTCAGDLLNSYHTVGCPKQPIKERPNFRKMVAAGTARRTQVHHEASFDREVAR